MAYTLPSPSYRKAPRGNNQLMQLLMSLIGGNGGAGDGYAEAKQANESRYQDILKLFGDTRGRSLDAIDSMSGQQEADANHKYDVLRNNMLSDLADRGLSGSTRRIPVELGTKRERDAAINRIQDAQREYRSTTDERFVDKAAGVMERRDDPYPKDDGSTALIGQLLGLAGGGGGLGGGLESLLGGRGPRSLKSRRPSVIAAPPAPPKYGPQNEYQDKDNGQSELLRRRLMGGLAAANATDGVDGQDRVRYALAQLQNAGLAEQNPNMGVPNMLQETAYAANALQGSGGGGGYYPSPNVSRPGYGPSYRQARRQNQNDQSRQALLRRYANRPAAKQAIAVGSGVGNLLGGLSNLLGAGLF